MQSSACIAILLLSPAWALRHETAYLADGAEGLKENCPDTCRSFNFVFMKTSGKSPAELQKEVNKKCKYSFCQGCAGGGGREGIPCCTPNCEVVEEEKAVEVEAKAAAAIAAHVVEDPCDDFLNQPGDSKLELSSLRNKFDPWRHHTDPFSGLPMWDSPAPAPVFHPAPAPVFHPAPAPAFAPAFAPSYTFYTPAPAFNFPSFTQPPLYTWQPSGLTTDPFSVWHVPQEDEDPPQDDGTAVYTPQAGEECQFLPGALFCPGLSYSPGSQYHKGFMHPLCCTLEEPATQTATTTTLLFGGYVPKPNEECEYVSGLWCPGYSYSPGFAYYKSAMQPLCCKEVEGTSVDKPVGSSSTAAPATTMPVTTSVEDEGSSVDPPTEEPLPEATAEDLKGYKAIKGEKCWHEPGASIRGRKFCPIPAYNVGKKYENEEGHPLCCQKMDHWYVTGKDDDEEVEDMADNFLANFTHVPEEIADAPTLREPDCPDHKEFVLQKYKLNCVEKTVCIDKQSGRPEDKICCSKKAKAVSDAMASYNKAMDICAKVPADSCHPLTKPDGLPAGFMCSKMFWCVNKKAGAEERVGPVATESLCQQLYLMPRETCGSTKLA